MLAGPRRPSCAVATFARSGAGWYHPPVRIAVQVSTHTFVSEDRVPLAAEAKQEIITGYAINDGDTGSPEVQIALLSERIR